MVVSKLFLANYLLESLASGEGHHLVDSSLEVVMDKFIIFVSPNCCNLIFGSKHFLRIGIKTMDSIMVLNTIMFSNSSMVIGPQNNKKIKYLFLKCLYTFHIVMWSVKKMQVIVIWRSIRLCLTMSNIWRYGQQWPAMCTTVNTIKC